MEKSITKAKGFTLIEVLIAGFILVLVVSTMTYVYRTAVLSSIKASNSVKVSGTIGLILTTIQSKIRSNNTIEPLSGNGVISGVKYQWQTTLVENKPAPPRYNADSGDFEQQKPRFFLWKVNLDVSSDSLKKSYEFQEISWRTY